MFVITGVTGQVGNAVASQLLAQGKPLRVIVRNQEKGALWASKGCEVVVAEYIDVAALTAAFTGAEGVFILMPPNYDPAPGFPETVKFNDAIRSALDQASPSKVVVLSTVGAHVERENLLVNLQMSEKSFASLSMPIVFLRAAWFMENSAWDLPDAKRGQINGYLQPPDHPIPMVAVKDIGVAVATLLEQTWEGRRIVELEGPTRYNACEIGDALSDAFGHEVRTHFIAQDEWDGLFRAQGASNPLPRIQMIQGFNEGWIDFEGGECEQWKGETSLATAIKALVAGRV